MYYCTVRIWDFVFGHSGVIRGGSEGRARARIAAAIGQRVGARFAEIF